eukprot:1781561-Prymnesium_polylepis.1
MWEVVECFRKLVFTGLMLFYQRGHIAQLLLGLVVALASSLLYSIVRPFSSRIDNAMAIASEVGIFVALAATMVTKFGNTLTEDDVVLVDTLLTTLFVLLLCSIPVLGTGQVAGEFGWEGRKSQVDAVRRLPVMQVVSRVSPLRIAAWAR